MHNMKSFVFAGIAAATLLTASAASAALIGDFQLNNSLANGVGGGVTLSNNGATLGVSGLTFGANQGPTISGLGILSVYTLETQFSFDSVSGYRKIADFYNLTSDTGFYVLSQSLNFYATAFINPQNINAGDLITVKLTRDASNDVSGYLNNVQQFTFNDSGNLAVIQNNLNLFRDDFPTGQREASSGFVNYITLDGTVDAGAVPEPSAWALMILGFGSAGAMIRRRRSLAVA